MSSEKEEPNKRKDRVKGEDQPQDPGEEKRQNKLRKRAAEAEHKSQRDRAQEGREEHKQRPERKDTERRG